MLFKKQSKYCAQFVRNVYITQISMLCSNKRSKQLSPCYAFITLINNHQSESECCSRIPPPKRIAQQHQNALAKLNKHTTRLVRDCLLPAQTRSVYKHNNNAQPILQQLTSETKYKCAAECAFAPLHSCCLLPPRKNPDRKLNRWSSLFIFPARRRTPSAVRSASWPLPCTQSSCFVSRFFSSIRSTQGSQRDRELRSFPFPAVSSN